MVRCGPGRSVTAPGKPSWVCFECVVEDGAFQGTSRWLSNEDPSERFCLGLGVLLRTRRRERCCVWKSCLFLLYRRWEHSGYSCFLFHTGGYRFSCNTCVRVRGLHLCMNSRSGSTFPTVFLFLTLCLSFHWFKIFGVKFLTSFKVERTVQ